MSQTPPGPPPLPEPYESFEPPKRRTGWIIAAVVILVIGGLATLASILLPSLSGARDLAREAVCQTNLRSIAIGLDLYKSDYGQFPPTLDMLVQEGYLDESELECPATGDFENSVLELAYFYLPPAAGAPHSALMAAEFEAPHPNGRSVLFVDGRVAVLSDADFRAELAKPENAAFAQAFQAAGGQGVVATTQALSAPLAHAAVSDDMPDHLVATPDAAVKKQVQQSFAFVPFGPARVGSYINIDPDDIWSDGSEMDLHARDDEIINLHAPTWELRKPLPVDLCFDVMIQEVATGKEYRADPLVIPAGRGGPDEPFADNPDDLEYGFRPVDVPGFVAGKEDGEVEVRIILKPSRALALTDPRIRSYYAETITSEPTRFSIQRIRVGKD